MHLIRRIFILIAVAFLFGSCQTENSIPLPYVKISGETMGTYYAITYSEKDGENFKQSIDSLLQALNKEVNTYDPSSTISQFNKAEKEIPVQIGGTAKTHFLTNFEKAKEVHKTTGGDLDVTIMPLTNYWGFGARKEAVTIVDSLKVDSLINFVGISNVKLEKRGDTTFLQKILPGVMLDFNSLAKGYGVDLVGKLLSDKGCENYLVEIGGEVVAKGVNDKNKIWNIAVNDPSEGAGLTDFVAVLPLENKGMATSGNYRNYYEVEGGRYGHTLNPSTGFPESHTLISASIVAPDCMTADALATACMVKGPNGAFEMIDNLEGVDGFLVFRNEEGTLSYKYTPGLEPYFDK